MSIWIIFKIIGSLALLIYGMKVMSEALPPYSRRNDHQPLHRTADRYVCNSLGTVVYGYHGDDRFVCQRRTANPCSSHLRHHGCQHRHNVHGVDYDARLLVQHGEPRVPCVLHRPATHLQQAPPLHRRLPLRRGIHVLRYLYARRNG